MSAFSDLDVAMQEKQRGRGRETPFVGGIGVCLDDEGQPPKLYRIVSINPGSALTVCPLDDKGDTGKTVQAADFWVLI